MPSVDPFAAIEIVDHEDPALDRARMDIDAYKESLDPAKIVELEGKRATRFTVRPLVPSYKTRELDGRAFAPMAHDVICASVVQVKYPDGAIKTAVTKPGAYGQPMAGHAWYDELAAHVGTDALYNLAAAILKLSKLPAHLRPTSPSSAG